VRVVLIDVHFLLAGGLIHMGEDPITSSL